MQDSETQFGAHYQVADRFLKAAHHIDGMVDTNLSNSALAAYESLKKHQISPGPLLVTPI